MSSRIRKYNGKKVFIFDEVKYITSKDARGSINKPVKSKNGKYYVTLANYKRGRILKRKFLSSAEGVLRRRRDRKKRIFDSWKKIVKEAKHRQRCKKLISRLRRCLRIKQTPLYARIRKRLECPRCHGQLFKYNKGYCVCHLCECWSGCKNPQYEDFMECSSTSCGYSERFVKLRNPMKYYPYRYRWN